MRKMRKKDSLRITKSRCIVCDKELQTTSPLDEMNSWNIAYDAIAFHAAGNYGSTVYDEEGEYLQAFVCDECLVRKAKVIRRVKTAPRRISQVAEFEVFDPERVKNDIPVGERKPRPPFVPYGPATIGTRKLLRPRGKKKPPSGS